MTNNLATTTPAEVIDISPEALEVANCFLQYQDIGKVAEELDMPVHVITKLLDRREVKAYVDNVFLSVGFNNRFTVRNLMDTIIKKKLEEMDDAGIGSSKDIKELLELSHKMTMDQLNAMIALKKLEENNIKTQTNIQINDAGGGSKYGALVERLIKGDIIEASGD